MRAFIRSDVRAHGSNEDGPLYEEFGYVVVEDELGFRKAHHISLPEAHIDKLDRLCMLVQAAINIAGWNGLDKSLWTDIDPCYGSAAHQRMGDSHLMDQDDIEAARLNGILIQ